VTVERYDKRKPPPFVCTKCQAGDCENCIDVIRAVMSDVLICKCRRKAHSCEPVDQQIKDPFTGAVHAPGLTVTKEGEVKRHE